MMTDKQYDRSVEERAPTKKSPSLDEDIEELRNRLADHLDRINGLENRISNLEGNMREVYQKIWDRDI